MTDPCDDFSSNECQDALTELYGYLDGELTVEVRTVIKTHLDLCAPCLESYSFETELRQVVSSRCQETVPDEVRLRIIAALEKELGPR